VCALRRENALAQSSPPVPQPRACISSGRASKNCPAQRSSGRCGCDLEAGTAVNMRISRVFDISSTKRRCRGCIGCEHTADRRAGPPKNASTGTGLSDVDISCDQSSRWQKFAAVPEEISSARCREKPTVCRRLVTPISQSCSRKRTSAAAAGLSALCPEPDLCVTSQCPLVSYAPAPGNRQPAGARRPADMEQRREIKHCSS